jgi:hypothetical protein
MIDFLHTLSSVNELGTSCDRDRHEVLFCILVLLRPSQTQVVTKMGMNFVGQEF